MGKRRDVLYEDERFRRHDPLPWRALYTIVGLPADSEKFASWLLLISRDNREPVMVAPAGGFMPPRTRKMKRIAYVLNTKDLARCIELL
jgi:aspartate/methionine/tyrosine aminotransferase